MVKLQECVAVYLAAAAAAAVDDDVSDVVYVDDVSRQTSSVRDFSGRRLLFSTIVAKFLHACMIVPVHAESEKFR